MRPFHRSMVTLTALLLSAAPIAAFSAPAAQAETSTPPVPTISGRLGEIEPTIPPTPSPGSVSLFATAQGLSRSGDIKVTLVTLQTADKTAADTASINLGAAQNAITSASNYWKTMSNNRISISIGKTVTGFKTSARSDQNFDSILTTVTKEIDWTANPNSALVVFMPRADVVVNGISGNLGGGWAGGATTGRVLMPFTSNFTNPVVAHEFGHVLGLMHANSLSCTNGAHDAPIVNGAITDPSCSSREYGDSTDLMGVSQYSQPFLNSVLYDFGSMGRGDEILNAGVAQGSKTYTLKAWAGTEANRAVKFTDPTSNETYYLQLRLPVGYDSTNAVNGNRGVEILKGDPRLGASMLIPPSTIPFSGWYNPNHAWQAGSTFKTSGSAVVTINSITADSATVTVQGDTTYLLVPQFNAAAVKNNLGAAVSGIVGGLKNGGAYQQFANGFVIYSPATGAHVSVGGIRSMYQQSGFENGALGYPTSDEVGGLKNGGVYQNYQGGAIIWSPATGAYISLGATRGAWAAQGYENGPLGYPTSNEVGGLKNGGVYQNYQGGAVVYSPATGAYVSSGDLRTAWTAQGYENGVLGYPTSNAYVTANGGLAQDYQGGKIVYSTTTGARILFGGIGGKYFSVGGFASALGLPTGNEVAGLKNGGVSQSFQNGTIVWSPATSAHIESGDIGALWAKSGAQNGGLGYPASDEIRGLKNGGSYQNYQGGAIVKSAAGTYISMGGIRTAWAAKGFESGILGYPTSNEYATANGTVTQDYQGGKIVWSPKNGTTVLLSTK